MQKANQLKYGLSIDDLNKILSILAAYPKVQKEVLFGSRAKGNFTTGSGIENVRI